METCPPSVAWFQFSQSWLKLSSSWFLTNTSVFPAQSSCFLQAHHAAEIGAGGIAVIAPSFFKPTTAGMKWNFMHTENLCNYTFNSHVNTLLVKLCCSVKLSITSVFCMFSCPSCFRSVEDVPPWSSQGCPKSAVLLLSYSKCHRCPRWVLLTFDFVLCGCMTQRMFSEMSDLFSTTNTLNVRRSIHLFSLVPAREVMEDIEKLIPSFRGVKFSGSDLMDFGQCVSYSQPHWSLLYGVDEVSVFSFCFAYIATWCIETPALHTFSRFTEATACSSGNGSPRCSRQVSV